MPASRWRRAAAGVIDMALLGLVWKGLAAFLAAGASAAGLPAAHVDLAAFLLTSVLAAIYAMGCWTLWSATLGTALLRVCVGDERFGAPMSTRQAWRRFVVWYLVGIRAFLVMLVSRDAWGRTWCGRASRTVVLADWHRGGRRSGVGARLSVSAVQNAPMSRIWKSVVPLP